MAVRGRYTSSMGRQPAVGSRSRVGEGEPHQPNRGNRQRRGLARRANRLARARIHRDAEALVYRAGPSFDERGRARAKPGGRPGGNRREPDERVGALQVHYAETFIVPAAAGRYTIRPANGRRRAARYGRRSERTHELRPTSTHRADHSPLGFRYFPGGYGPQPEVRKLDSIRASLLDPQCSGPADVYAIAMDVGRVEYRDVRRAHAVVWSRDVRGREIGRGTDRSQGQCIAFPNTAVEPSGDLRDLVGPAHILMQEHAADDPGRCFAIYAKAGELVLVPPGWAHATISAIHGTFDLRSIV